MGQMAIGATRYDDPRKLRDLLGRAESLASEHALTSVVVGLAGREGDIVLPELIDFFESALRVDDSVFRMTRERAVLFLADVDRRQAASIVDRLLNDFRERFAPKADPEVAIGFYEIAPGSHPLTVKQVLPALFGVATSDDD